MEIIDPPAVGQEFIHRPGLEWAPGEDRDLEGTILVEICEFRLDDLPGLRALPGDLVVAYNGKAPIHELQCFKAGSGIQGCQGREVQHKAAGR
jgi:hypothetical protein